MLLNCLMQFPANRRLPADRDITGQLALVRHHPSALIALLIARCIVQIVASCFAQENQIIGSFRSECPGPTPSALNSFRGYWEAAELSEDFLRGLRPGEGFSVGYDRRCSA